MYELASTYDGSKPALNARARSVVVTGNRQWIYIQRAVDHVEIRIDLGRGAIGCVNNGRAGRRRGDGHRLRRVVKTMRHAKSRLHRIAQHVRRCRFRSRASAR